MMALVLEINEARSINLVIGDNLLLLARKALDLSGLSFSQGDFLSVESRNIFCFGPWEISLCRWMDNNWLVVKVYKLGWPLWWILYCRIQNLNIIEWYKVSRLLLSLHTTILVLAYFCLFNACIYLKLKMIC